MKSLEDILTENYIASQGRNGDTELAHITKDEANLLESLGGAGTTNPKTGLREFHSPQRPYYKSPNSEVKNYVPVEYNGEWIYMTGKEYYNFTHGGDKDGKLNAPGVMGSEDDDAYHEGYQGGAFEKEEYKMWKADGDALWYRFREGKLDDVPDNFGDTRREVQYNEQGYESWQFGVYGGREHREWQKEQWEIETRQLREWNEKYGGEDFWEMTGPGPEEEEISSIFAQTDADGNVLYDEDGEMILGEEGDAGVTEIATVSHRGTEALNELFEIIRDPIRGNTNVAEVAKRMLIHQALNSLEIKKTKPDGSDNPEYWLEHDRMARKLGNYGAESWLENRYNPAPNEWFNERVHTNEQQTALQTSLDNRNRNIKDANLLIAGYEDDIIRKEGEIEGYEADIVGYGEDITGLEVDIETGLEKRAELYGGFADIAGKKAGLREAQFGKLAEQGLELTPEMKEYYARRGGDISAVTKQLQQQQELVTGEAEKIRGYREDIGQERQPGPDGIMGTEDDILPTGKFWDIYEAEEGIGERERDIGELGYYDPTTGEGAGEIGKQYEDIEYQEGYYASGIPSGAHHFYESGQPDVGAFDKFWEWLIGTE